MYRNVSGPRRMPVLERSMTVQEEGGKSKVYRKQTSPRSLSFKILPLQNLFATRKPTPRKFPNPTISPPNYEFQNISFYAEPADKIVGFPTRIALCGARIEIEKNGQIMREKVHVRRSLLENWPYACLEENTFLAANGSLQGAPLPPPHPLTKSDHLKGRRMCELRELGS